MSKDCFKAPSLHFFQEPVRVSIETKSQQMAATVAMYEAEVGSDVNLHQGEHSFLPHDVPTVIGHSKLL